MEISSWIYLANDSSVGRRAAAGAAGFEPAIPGPKPGALPLGYAPSLDGRAAGMLLEIRPSVYQPNAP